MHGDRDGYFVVKTTAVPNSLDFSGLRKNQIKLFVLPFLCIEY